VSNTSQITFPCLELTQPIGTFYVGVVPVADVLYISKADIRHIEDDDIGLAIGIQRKVSPSRVKEIGEYVSTLDATFPTSIILAVSAEHAKYTSRDRSMSISRKEDIASIIDGQHRLKGLEGFEGRFDLNVTIFVDMETQDKANVFATINLAQTKVNKSLVYDLYEYAKTRSPQKTAHEIAKLLNYETESPFYRRIKILGVATGQRSETITQATFVESLLPLISRKPLVDRDTLRRKRSLDPVEGAEAKRLCFRNMFIEKKDAEIAKVIWNYFSAVADRWNEAWGDVRAGNMLNRTSGFKALMRFLRDVYVAKCSIGDIPSKKKFASVFQDIRFGDSRFTVERYKPGTSGESQLLADLRDASGIPEFSV
jgi:DGQHR domain-containing protein